MVLYISIWFIIIGILWLLQIILQNLKSLGSIAASSNRYSFDTDNMCVGIVCNDFEIGFVMAELQDKRKATTHRYV